MNKFNRSVDSIKNQELAIDKVKQKIDELQYFKEMGVIKDNEVDKLNNLTRELDIMESRLEQSKLEANQLKEKIIDVLDQDNSKTEKSIKNVNKRFKETNSLLERLGKRILSLLSAQLIFNVLGRAISSLKDNFFSLLKTNDEFNSQLNQIKANLMTAFAPIYNACLPAINTLMNTLSKLTGTIAIFVSSLFNQSLADSNKQAKKLSNSLNKVSKSGDKASGSLSSIDKLEVIQDNSSSSGGSSTPESSGIDYNGEIQYSQKLLGILNKIKDFIKPIWDFIVNFQKEHGTLATAIMVICGALAGLFILKSIKKLFTGFGKGVTGLSADFTGFFDGLGKAANSIAVLGGLALVIGQISDLITAFSASGLSLKDTAILLGSALGIITAAFIVFEGAMKLLEPSWQSIASAAVILGGLAIVLHEVTELIKAFSESGMETNEVTSMMTDILLVLIGLIASLTVAAQLMQSPMAMAGVAVLVASICATLLTLAATLPTILEACSHFINNTAPSIQKTISVIGEQIQGIIFTLGTVLPPILNSTGNLFDSIFSGISKVITTVGNTFINIMQSTDNLIGNVLFSILDFIAKLGPATNIFVDNMIVAITKLINFVVSAVEYLINTAIVNPINSLINKINNNAIAEKLGWSIDNIGKVSIDRFVPRLATGAVIPPRQEFAAILGDQKHGTNIEAPLETIKQANREVLAEFFNKMKNWPSEVIEVVLKNITFVLQFGTGPIQKLVMEAIRLTEKEIGKQLLVN